MQQDKRGTELKVADFVLTQDIFCLIFKHVGLFKTYKTEQTKKISMFTDKWSHRRCLSRSWQRTPGWNRCCTESWRSKHSRGAETPPSSRLWSTYWKTEGTSQILSQGNRLSLKYFYFETQMFFHTLRFAVSPVNRTNQNYLSIPLTSSTMCRSL